MHDHWYVRRVVMQKGQVVFGFIRHYSQGNKFIDRLAAEIGVDDKIYKAALTEMNLNFAAFNGMFKAEAATTPNENERISHFAQMSLEGAFEGAKRMKQKFPNENSIDDFISRLGQYAAKANQEHNGREAAPDIMVGETNGDKIGCYLLWFVKKGETERSYHSVATSLDRLKEDYVHFFEQIVEQKKEILRQLPDRRPASETRRTSDGGLKIPTSDLIRNQHEHDLKVAENCLKNTFFIEKYLDSEAGKKPFIEIGGMEIWMGTGVRPRQKMNGEYVE